MDKIIPFNKNIFCGDEVNFLQAVEKSDWMKESGKLLDFLGRYFSTQNCFLTNSCSSALHLSLAALDLQKGDEIIIPAFGYVAVANAVVNNGAIPVFADVGLEDCNISLESIVNCITPRTRAVIGIHYAGNAFDVQNISALCNKRGLVLIEDAAQAFGSTYLNKPLGSFGHIACISFDYMKNVTCGQGGLVIVNEKSFLEKIQILHDNGTNKHQFENGEKNHFEWVGKGFNFNINPIASYFLGMQIESIHKINEIRMASWNIYSELLKPLEGKGYLALPKVQEGHNAHIFYVREETEQARASLRNYLLSKNIISQPHYSSLAYSPFGKAFYRELNSIKNAEKLSGCLLRLPLWNTMQKEEVLTVVDAVSAYYQ